MKELKGISFIFLILIPVLFIVGCDQDDDSNSGPTTEHQLIVSPEKIMLNDDETGLLYLTIQPAGEFQWNITSKPDWIEISPTSGTISREIIELELTPDYTGLNEGKHSGVIEIITNGAGSAKVNIELSVNPRPLADVSPNELTFSEGESEKKITLSNIGTGFLNWELGISILTGLDKLESEIRNSGRR